MTDKGTYRFDEMIRNSVANHEAPYEPAQWWDMENRLNKRIRINRLRKWGTGIGIVAVLAAGSFVIYDHFDNPAEPVPEQISAQSGEKINVTGPKTEQTTSIEAPEQQLPVTIEQPAVNQPVESNSDQPSDNYGQQTTPDPVQPTQDTTQPAQANYTNPRIQSSISPVNHPDFEISSSTICAGSLVEFKGIQVPDACIVEWFFGDGQRGNGNNCLHRYLEEGHYDVEMQIRHNSGSTNIRTKKDAVTVLPTPEAAFSFTVNDGQTGALPLVLFENTSFGQTSSLWLYGDGETGTVTNAQHLYNNKGTYKAGLVVSNAAGCSDTLYQSILIKRDYNLLAPNSFSPNGDGINDTWIPMALQYEDFTFKLNIIDRSSGKVVFSTTDAANQWDGHLGNSGSKAQPGSVFGWIAEVKDKNGITRKYTGSITVLY